MNLRDALVSHRDEFVESASNAPFIVFLCGPKLSSRKPSARLRKRLKKALEKDKFEVVLGEDDGLDNPVIQDIGINAQDNELEFIKKSCGAVIIVADSVGAFCELALFGWHFVHKSGHIDSKKTACFVLLDTKYQKHKSYLNAGPVASVNGSAFVEYIDFPSYDFTKIIERLKSRRGTSTVDNKRGRPRKAVI